MRGDRNHADCFGIGVLSENQAANAYVLVQRFRASCIECVSARKIGSCKHNLFMKIGKPIKNIPGGCMVWAFEIRGLGGIWEEGHVIFSKIFKIKKHPKNA